jgi:hypothetical protein
MQEYRGRKPLASVPQLQVLPRGEVRGETKIEDELSITGRSAVPDELAAGLLAGPLGTDSCGGGIAGMLAESTPVEGPARKKQKVPSLP